MRPETKALYPDNWPEISKAYIEKCNRICVDCGRTDRTDQIVLTTHHKDYNPSNNDESNFACLCQGCHLKQQAYDLAEATRHYKIDLLIRMGQLCFPGMAPKPAKRLSRVISGKALATSHRTADHAPPDSEQ